LLLGLKGSLNEYELDILRLRSLEARHEKARRGELVISAPVGFIKTAEGCLEKDPDRRVQNAIHLVFQKTLELGAVRQALLWLLEKGIGLPARQHGPLGWETVWKRPTYPMLQRILAHPAYAGIYAYGKTEAVMEYREGKASKKFRRKPREEWLALLPDRHEGYIARETYERIQTMIAKNAQAFLSTSPGAAKRGSALLVGLLRCRRCGRKIGVRYTGRSARTPRYCCLRGQLDHAEPRCINLGALDADEAVAQEILRAVAPGAVEAAVRAGEEAAAGHDDAIAALQLDLQAARYTAQKAWKQYDAADPENRLVTCDLEKRWNVALEKVRELEDRIGEAECHRKEMQPPTLTEFKDLAANLDQVWNDAQTDVRLKKRIVRTLVEEVVADVDCEAGEVILVVHWKGGVHTELKLRRRRRGETRQAAPTETVEAVRALTLICNDVQIAGYLNRNGLRTGRGNRWTRERVT
jgi:DNA invertase Pin-like site-specific DNA recombinase